MVDQTMAHRNSLNPTAALGQKLPKSAPSSGKSHHQEKSFHKQHKTRKGNGAKAKTNRPNKTPELGKLGRYEVYQLEDNTGRAKAGTARKAEEQQARKQTSQIPADPVIPRTRRQAKKLRTRNARKAEEEEQEASRKHTTAAAQSDGEHAHVESVETRSKPGEQPLGFASSYLSKMGDQSAFMNNDQITVWIESVQDPHLRDWYYKCLSVPASRPHFEDAEHDPLAFVKAVVEEAIHQHDSTRLLQALLGEADACPTAHHIDLSRHNRLTFVQHAAMVACLIVRDGRRGGPFATCTDEETLHRAAAMLLVSVIKDLINRFGYFARLFTGVKPKAKKPKTETKEKSKTKENRVVKQNMSMKTSKTVNVPVHLSGYIEKVLRDRKQLAIDCKITFERSRATKKPCPVYLVGTVDQVEASAKAIEMLVNSSKA